MISWCCFALSRSCQGIHVMVPCGLNHWCTRLSSRILGMVSESRCSDVHALRSTMRCTTSLSSLGGACSAQALGAGLCVRPKPEGPAVRLPPSPALVSALHLLLRSNALGQSLPELSTGSVAVPE